MEIRCECPAVENQSVGIVEVYSGLRPPCLVMESILAIAQNDSARFPAGGKIRVPPTKPKISGGRRRRAYGFFKGRARRRNHPLMPRWRWRS